MSTCKSYDDLPQFLNANLVAQVLGLSSDTISIHGYLLSWEYRKTDQCLVSYRMISETIRKPVTTVRKYVAQLEERLFVRTERTNAVTKEGRIVVGQAVAAVRCSAPLDEHWKDAIEEDFRKRQKKGRR